MAESQPILAHAAPQGSIDFAKVRARFELRFTKLGPNECWPWNGHRRKRGHGLFLVSGIPRGKKSSSRWAYILYVGPISDDLMVCHKCNNGWCVNPSHLYAGTAKDNTADLMAAGFNPTLNLHCVGEQNPSARLTEETVIEIRTRYAAGGVSHIKLANEFGVTKGAVWCAITRRTWRHVSG